MGGGMQGRRRKEGGVIVIVTVIIIIMGSRISTSAQYCAHVPHTSFGGYDLSSFVHD